VRYLQFDRPLAEGLPLGGESSRIFSQREGFDLGVDPSGKLRSRPADAAQERVHETLKARQAELAALAQALLSQEVVDRATLLGILSAHGSQANVVADSQDTQEAARLRSLAQS
jgi:hypothetical protein